MASPTIRNIPAQEELINKFSLREIIFKYLAYLPLFLLCIVVFLGGGAIYIRYAVPKFKATANMLVKIGDDNSISANNNDLISSTLLGGRRVNLDNEIERLRSASFLERVVLAKHFNINYFNEGKIKRSDLYHDCPFEMIPVQIIDSTASHSFYVNVLNDGGGEISKKIKEKGNKISFKWNDTIRYEGNIFILKPRNNSKISISLVPYFIIWKPIGITAAQIKGGLIVTSLSSKTTIITLSLVSENANEAKDILNTIITEYRQSNIEDKNKVSQNTIDFINERINVITKELKEVTTDLQDYKIKNNILDIQRQFSFYFDNSFANVKAVDGIDINLQVLQLLDDYLSKETNENKLVPSNLGITDNTLNFLVTTYNGIQLAKEKITPFVLKNNSQLADLQNQSNEVRKSILENIKNIRKNLLKQKSELNIKSKEYQDNLTTIPQKEVELQEITRQQTIKQQLYLYLLQKREETAIASSATVSDYQQIDVADASNTPVEPRESNIRMFTLILGLLIPISIIYVLDLLNDKLTTRDDIVRKTNIPIVGEISHVDKTMSTIVVGQSRNMIAEQFRILRSNLQFVLKENGTKNCKTFLVTSSISGEGKSFISLNLAAVLALSDKKVALLEFDLRKMRSTRYVGEKQNSKGITNFLIGQVDNPEDIISSIDKFPSLDIYRSGPIPPNPGELVMSDKVKAFFDWLKERYDFIVIDSAPVGLVSDSYSLVEYSQAVLYVVRQRYTFKRQIDFVEDINRQEKLKNVSLVVNDVHMGGKYGYYGYGYGYGYGYIYRYGFGYRYGYGYGAYAGKYFKKGTDGYFDLPGKGKK